MTHHDVRKDIAGLQCVVSVNLPLCLATLAVALAMTFQP